MHIHTFVYVVSIKGAAHSKAHLPTFRHTHARIDKCICACLSVYSQEFTYIHTFIHTFLFSWQSSSRYAFHKLILHPVTSLSVRRAPCTMHHAPCAPCPIELWSVPCLLTLLLINKSPLNSITLDTTNKYKDEAGTGVWYLWEGGTRQRTFYKLLVLLFLHGNCAIGQA